MELLQLVRVRGERWRVVDIRPYESCRLLTLRSAEPGSPAVTRSVLTPFDEVETIARRDRPHRVRPVVWRRACRALVAADTPPGALRTAARAAIDLLPHQLDPALAIVGGLGTRVLLADDVGLGKTIQAGLILAELVARGAVERVLVVTPAGVRDQWARELSERFRIEPFLADARALRHHAATLPIGLNPWATLPIVVTSIDYIKRPEILPAVNACRWDAIVVDEAHATAGDSDRHAAVHALASRTPYVLLLTATPHNGDARAFAALCDLGRIEADSAATPLLVFRRTRQQIRGDAIRRVHMLLVRPTALEERMHACLARYTRAVRDEHGERALALSVLDKRAFSSPWALAQSVQRRLQTIESIPDRNGGQLLLPLEDGDGEATTEDEPPSWPTGLELSDVARERQLLAALLDAARHAAARGESKLRALRRLIRRAREPIVVFTEYRDTALHVQAAFDGMPSVLHGGLSREQRLEVLDRFCTTHLSGDSASPGSPNGLRYDNRSPESAFLNQRSAALQGCPAAAWQASRPALREAAADSETRSTGLRYDNRLLVATDAAGQGLNLHRACRIVVNLELPWNPMRLEQRIGRVDRIGQSRAVHAFHLVAATTGETDILSRLKDRIEAARAAVDAPDPIGSSRHDADTWRSALGTAPAERIAAAAAEAARLSAARAFTITRDDTSLEQLECSRPWIMRARRSKLRAALGRRTILVYRLVCEDAAGRTAESQLVPLAVHDDDLAAGWPPVPAAVIQGVVVPAAVIQRWHGAVGLTVTAFWAARIAREHAIESTLVLDRELVQGSLFDRRAERAHADRVALLADKRMDRSALLADLVRRSTVAIRPPELLLVVVP